MFSFIAQLLIFLSIVGIIILVLRKVRAVGRLTAQASWTRLPLEALKMAAGKIREGALFVGKKLWRLILDAKGLSSPGALSRMSQPFKKIILSKPNLNIFKRSEKAGFYLSEAEENLEKENYDKAERLFIRAIEKDPRSEEAYAGLGRLYLAQKKFEEAIETYKYLAKHFPTNDTYFANLGQSYHGQKLYESAIEAYERAIELAPENARRYVNLGLTLEARKHLEEAVLNYRKAVELEKTNPQFLLVLAEALVKKGDKEEAELMLEQVLQLEPTNHTAREQLMRLKF